jgi:predicted nucleic acid-binding protein
MPDEAVVADSGPLIALAIGRCLHLLDDLYGKVLVPDAVWREVTEVGHGKAGAAEISAASWIERTALVHAPDPLLRAELGPGEAEAIALAADRNGLLIIDERQARRIAEIAYGLPVRGTVGTLVLAKRRGLIVEVRPLLERMRQGGYYLADALIEAACESVGEGRA